jgi:acyl transferase domain-containing protein
MQEKGAESWHLLPLSARTDGALRKAVENLADYLHQCSKAELANVAYTLQIGRRQFAHRWTTVCRTLQDAIAALHAGVPESMTEATEEKSNKIAFLFPGEDSQDISMGRDLYRNEGTFRRNMQRCAEIVRPQLGMNICDALEGESWEDVEEPWFGQPALFAIEYSLAQLWMSWGIRPQAMLGHGLGEYTAACIAGVLSLEDALTMVAVRGKLLQEMAPGAMLAIPLPESQVDPMLPDGICVAAINAPNLCTVAGTREDLENLKASLQERALHCQWLKTRRGLHSSLMDPMMESFLAQLRRVRFLAPRIPFISNVTGKWITDAEAQDPIYWVSHLRQPVQFERGLQHLMGDPEWTVVEVGPGQTLRQLVQLQKPNILAVSSMPGDGTLETKSLLQALGQLWEAGTVIDWKVLSSGKGCNRVPLPTYPFEKRRYWIEPSEESTEATQPEAGRVRPPNQYSARPLLRNDYVPPQNEMEQQIVTIIENALGVRPVGVTDKYGELGGDSLMAIRIIEELNSSFRRNLRVADLYEGLAVRDLMSLMGYGSPIESGDSGHEQERIERRRLYQKHRRSLHEIEPS